MKRAVVVFSGGQDSTTCLIHALHQYDEVHCITFDYDQRHRAEIEVARELACKLNIESHKHKVLNISFLNELSISSLTRDNILVPTYTESIENTIPNTFVPGRNILFLTLAAAYAYQVEAKAVVIGVCETDFSGYPDCRDEFVKALNYAVNLGMNKEKDEDKIRFETPLMWLNKAEIWALADHYGKLKCVCNDTLTCYKGIKAAGCVECAACHLRAKGLEEYEKNKESTIDSLKKKFDLPQLSPIATY